MRRPRKYAIFLVLQQAHQSLLGSNATLKAEIRWTLKVIRSHYSFKSCEDISSIFKFMFPDCERAKHFACKERKEAYLATFGIASHFLSLLRANVSKNQTTSNICGNGQKIDFAHTFKFDTLSC